MSDKTETWYVLEDGSAGDPREIAPGKDGKLVHKDGRKVAYAPHGPRSRGGVDADAERAKEPKKAPFAGKGDHDGDGKAGGAVKPEATETRDLTAEKPKRGYKTRESKAG